MIDIDTGVESCPFCGGEAELEVSCEPITYVGAWGKIYEEQPLFYTVKCRNEKCCCRIGNYEGSAMAIDAWNSWSDRLEKEICALPKILSSDEQDYVQLYDVLRTIRKGEE